MTALVDTAVWSLALRRVAKLPSPEALELARLIREGEAAIIGAVRQEILSGIKSQSQFENLRQHLRGFEDVELETADFELAAEFHNRCKDRGIQGSSTDFLICAVASRRQLSVFTTDGDFVAFGKVIPVQLHVPQM